VWAVLQPAGLSASLGLIDESTAEARRCAWAVAVRGADEVLVRLLYTGTDPHRITAGWRDRPSS
jgi:hypothetical protein